MLMNFSIDICQKTDLLLFKVTNKFGPTLILFGTKKLQFNFTYSQQLAFC